MTILLALGGVALLWWLRDLLPELWTIALVAAVVIHYI